MCFSASTLPTSEADWEKPEFVHKTHHGYYNWPQSMLIYAKSEDQPQLVRTRDELNDVEKEFFDFFTDEANMEQLFKYFTLEEKKGFDR